MSTKPTVGDLVRAIEATVPEHPGLRWYGTPHPHQLPNGRYVVCHQTGEIWISEHLDPTGWFDAMLDGLTDLRHGATPETLPVARRGNVVPLRRGS